MLPLRPSNRFKTKEKLFPPSCSLSNLRNSSPIRDGNEKTFASERYQYSLRRNACCGRDMACRAHFHAAALRRCPRSAANPASILSRPYPIRNRSDGVAPNSDRYTLAGSSNTPLSSTSRRANSSTPSRPVYGGYPIHPPSGRYHSNKPANSAKKVANIGKFLAISARFRSRIRSRAFNAICASNSLGAAPQIDV